MYIEKIIKLLNRITLEFLKTKIKDLQICNLITEVNCKELMN